MNIIITGAAGFVGSRLADTLLQKHSKVPVAKLLLLDVIQPQKRNDPRVTTLAIDLTAPGDLDRIIDPDSHILFHLAAIVSGHAEADFDMGLKVNFDATRVLLEVIRRKAPNLRFVFTSTVGVFGGTLPDVIDDFTAVTPQNSYGTQKAMCELLINDYARKGYLDGRIVRLPTVSVRAGAANKAVTSFASGIVREPLNGEVCVCPVDPSQELWLTSPNTVVANIIHASVLPTSSFGVWRVVNLPGFRLSVDKMLQALRQVAGDNVAKLVRFERDELIARMVASFPTNFDNKRALDLGFSVDTDFVEVIKNYILDDLKR